MQNLSYQSLILFSYSRGNLTSCALFWDDALVVEILLNGFVIFSGKPVDPDPVDPNRFDFIANYQFQVSPFGSKC